LCRQRLSREFEVRLRRGVTQFRGVPAVAQTTPQVDLPGGREDHSLQSGGEIGSAGAAAARRAEKVQRRPQGGTGDIGVRGGLLDASRSGPQVGVPQDSLVDQGIEARVSKSSKPVVADRPRGGTVGVPLGADLRALQGGFPDFLRGGRRGDCTAAQGHRHGEPKRRAACSHRGRCSGTVRTPVLGHATAVPYLVLATHGLTHSHD
jgi:hypothetical protein